VMAQWGAELVWGVCNFNVGIGDVGAVHVKEGLVLAIASWMRVSMSAAVWHKHSLAVTLEKGKFARKPIDGEGTSDSEGAGMQHMPSRRANLPAVDAMGRHVAALAGHHVDDDGGAGWGKEGFC
jgi:hypothetical protein